MALLGLGNPLVDVNFDTIVQRVAPESVMGRVFGAMESCFIATMALGVARHAVRDRAGGCRRRSSCWPPPWSRLACS